VSGWVGGWVGVWGSRKKGCFTVRVAPGGIATGALHSQEG
jgi:hypothetical protein